MQLWVIIPLGLIILILIAILIACNKCRKTYKIMPKIEYAEDRVLIWYKLKSPILGFYFWVVLRQEKHPS